MSAWCGPRRGCCQVSGDVVNDLTRVVIVAAIGRYVYRLQPRFEPLVPDTLMNPSGTLKNAPKTGLRAYIEAPSTINCRS